MPVEEARESVLSRIRPIAPIELPLQEAYGCVLARDVVAEADLPTFASSAMDGYAVRASDVAGATGERPVRLRVVGRAPIGRRPEGTVGSGEAVKIATGAPIPAGADCIAPIEVCRVEGDAVVVLEPSAEGKHIRPAGEDARAGDVLVSAGQRLGAPELGLLSASGFGSAPAYPRPRVVVLSTGDELIETGQEPEFGQVRDSNAYTLFGAIREAGAIPVLSGVVRDDVEELQETILTHLVQADVFVSSGGVSVGERDVVKTAFADKGDIDFFRVAMQPGKPQGFGFIEGKPYFGLPGNPVSVFVSFEVFIRPALMKMMGRKQLFRPEVTARSDTDIAGAKGKTKFARVHVRRIEGGWLAAPTGARGSNLISTVSRANGLGVIPPNVGTLPAGAPFRVMLFRSSED